MTEKILIDKLAESVGKVPERADVIAVRQYSHEDMQRRTKSFLASISEVFRQSVDRGDWIQQKDRTLINLPHGSRAIVYHASGAMKLVTGLNPMDSIFPKMEDRTVLEKLITEKARRLDLNRWVGKNESLQFERIWQIKAQAMSNNGQISKPILCRAVGAYRHVVEDLPVWGPASVAIKVAADGVLDSFILHIRESTGEVVDRPEILRPERAAGAITKQLIDMMGKSKISIGEVANPRWMRFGYMNLSKRKIQRFLAPVFVAGIDIENQEEAQAYLFVASATEKSFQPLFLDGKEAPLANLRQSG